MWFLYYFHRRYLFLWFFLHLIIDKPFRFSFFSFSFFFFSFLLLFFFPSSHRFHLPLSTEFPSKSGPLTTAYQSLIQLSSELDGKCTIDYKDLKFICKIGEGMFGDVHRAQLWGMDVAVKKLKCDTSAFPIEELQVFISFNSKHAQKYSMFID